MDNIYTEEQKAWHTDLLLDLMQLVNHRNKTGEYIMGYRHSICFFVKECFNVIYEDNDIALKETRDRIAKSFDLEYLENELNKHCLPYEKQYKIEIDKLTKYLNITENEMANLNFKIIKGKPEPDKELIYFSINHKRHYVEKFKDYLVQNGIEVFKIGISNKDKKRFLIVNKVDKEKAEKLINDLREHKN